MIVAMKLGMVIYHIKLDTVLAGTTFATLNVEHPAFGHWMMVASIALAMVVFMRYYHKSSWQYCGEMTVAMLIPPAVLTVPMLHVLAPVEFLQTGSNWLMIPTMAALMLYRGGHHVPATSRAGHQQNYSSDGLSSGAHLQAPVQPRLLRRPLPGIPRWMKVCGLWIIGLAAVLFLISLFGRGHHHRGGRHGEFPNTTEHGERHL
jgi:hypothetical protein